MMTDTVVGHDLMILDSAAQDLTPRLRLKSARNTASKSLNFREKAMVLQRSRGLLSLLEIPR